MAQRPRNVKKEKWQIENYKMNHISLCENFAASRLCETFFASKTPADKLYYIVEKRLKRKLKA